MPYSNTPDWRVVVKDKWLLFDADAIISIIAFGAEQLLNDLKQLGITFNYIHPVLLELMNTNSSAEKLKRSTILTQYNFVELLIRDREINLANRIQESLPLNIKFTPSSTDFYLGGVIARYCHNDNAYLLTSNTKDFPMPIYPRKAFIPLHNQTDVKAMTILGLDESKLVDLQEN
jgi:hypothetical protein